MGAHSCTLQELNKDPSMLLLISRSSNAALYIVAASMQDVPGQGTGDPRQESDEIWYVLLI